MLSACKDKWIKYLVIMETLVHVTKEYETNCLPGCGGSVNVAQLKWSWCSAGEFNRACGKEQFPTAAFECVTDNKHRTHGVISFLFWSKKQQMYFCLIPSLQCLPPNDAIRMWYRYILAGEIKEFKSICLICDNSYLIW